MSTDCVPSLGVLEMNQIKSLPQETHSLYRTHMYIRTMDGRGDNGPAVSGWDMPEVSSAEVVLVLSLE